MSHDSPPIPAGFTPWSGGKNPAPGKRVQVLFDDQDIVSGQSEQFKWEWLMGGIGGDVLAYRVVPANG